MTSKFAGEYILSIADIYAQDVFVSIQRSTTRKWIAASGPEGTKRKPTAGIGGSAGMQRRLRG
jgi:hypothetical protein